MSYQPAPLPPPVLRVGSSFTFVGVFQEFQEDCETMYRKNGWAESTREQYASAIMNTIYPNLSNHNFKAIEDYSRKDFDLAISNIVALGKRNGNSKDNKYTDSTIQGFYRLIKTVVTVAYERGCTLYNIFANDFSEADKKRLLDYHRMSNLNPKSFSVTQEFAIAKFLAQSWSDHGESLGLLLMFSLGLRCAEAAGASFDDIIQIEGSDFFCLRVLQTTSQNSSTLKVGGKTKNAIRLIPLPQSIVEILKGIEEERRRTLQRSNIDLANERLPIACVGADYLKRCSAPTLSRAGKAMFAVIGIKKEYLTSIKLSIEQDLLAAKELSAEEQYDLIEKDPTAYSLRRNFATHLYLLGLDENEISYIMGHKIENRQIRQKEYSSPELLFRIKEKLDQRPILNPISEAGTLHTMTGNQVISLNNVNNHIFEIPPNSSVSITATPLVPGDDLSVRTSEATGGSIVIHRCSYTNNSPHRPVRASMIGLYHRKYKEVIGAYVLRYYKNPHSNK